MIIDVDSGHEYGWNCPVCNVVLDSETCPRCPGVLLLKVKKTHAPKADFYYWRRIA